MHDHDLKEPAPTVRGALLGILGAFLLGGAMGVSSLAVWRILFGNADPFDSGWSFYVLGSACANAMLVTFLLNRPVAAALGVYGGFLAYVLPFGLSEYPLATCIGFALFGFLPAVLGGFVAKALFGFRWSPLRRRSQPRLPAAAGVTYNQTAEAAPALLRREAGTMAESVLYENKGVRITTEQAAFARTTYRVSSIQSVGKQPLLERTGWTMLALGMPGTIFLAGGVAGLLERQGAFLPILAIALALLLLALAAWGAFRLWFVTPSTSWYILTISMGGKSEQVLLSDDEDFIDAVRDAVEQAMAHHPAAVETRFRESSGDRRPSW